MKSLINSNNKITKNTSLITTNMENEEFDLIMMLYKKGLDTVVEQFLKLKDELNKYYGYEMINNVTSRIKTPDSIINKMIKKEYELNCENLVERIEDIAGVRLICTFKDDIYKIRDIILQTKGIQVIKEKDYIKKAKKSGYSAYHMIVKIPIKVENQTIFMKVEIQIRTMLMDFWASTEHKIKYKTNKKLSNKDSKKLFIYAKIINLIGDNMMKIYRKQTRKNQDYIKI